MSWTHLAAAREFVPSNLYADPLLSNTAIVKQDGPPQPDLDYALTVVQSQSRFVDDGTLWGTARVRVDTGGDRTVTSAEVDRTFPTNTATFTDYNIPLGVAYRSIIVKMDAAHGAGTAKTPDILPVAIFGEGQGRALETFAVVLNTLNQNEDPVAMTSRLRTAKQTKMVQQFQGGGYDCLAKVVDWDFVWKPTLGSQPPNWGDVSKAVIVFKRVHGAVS